ncbi:high mobility group B protein 15-like [Actinidia eriantha]|uniref:high mobility group B protein 15-like n=1 Tax=Actinidia eriantha TaxID=165200 RepID=UPI0025897BB9|nr:high mobility group B protein 15-like [Actinidia eriantha]
MFPSILHQRIEGMTEESGGGGDKGKVEMESTSAANQGPVPNSSNYFPYPTPLARYEDVVVSPKLFMDTLEKLHAAMGTKFMIPIIGGKDLDLHRLFVEVTSRGGILKIIREKKWKEVTAVFSFPSTATNASFVMRKYYMSLLYHYEQIHFFNAKGWSPSADPFQNLSSPPILPKRVAEQLLPLPEIKAVPLQPKRTKATEFSLGGVVSYVMVCLNLQMLRLLQEGDKTSTFNYSNINLLLLWLQPTSLPPTASPVIGVIDGKFESGYLVTVTLGSETLKGVLYQTAPNPTHQSSQNQSVHLSVNDNNAATTSGAARRRRRKKSEMKRRDPAHPKPNRSGYNFFFSEQHARLKPLYPGKDREISRMIGELWTKMNETERAVYQDKAVKDKERYKTEMEDYKERLRTGQIISNAVPIQQRPLQSDATMVETGLKMEIDVGESFQTPENEFSSGNSGKSDDSDDKTDDKELDMEIPLGVEVGSENVQNKNLVGEEILELEKREDKVGKGRESSDDIVVETEKESVPSEEKESVPCEEKGEERESSDDAILVETEKESVPSEEKASVPCEERESVSCEAKESVHSEAH